MVNNFKKRLTSEEIDNLKNQLLEKYPDCITTDNPENIKALKIESEEYLLSLAESAVAEAPNGIQCLAAEIACKLHSDKEMTCFPQYTLAVIIEGTANKKIPETLLEDLCEAGCHFNMYNEELLLKYVGEGKIFPKTLWNLITVPWGYEIYKDNLIVLLKTGVAAVISSYLERQFPEVEV